MYSVLQRILQIDEGKVIVHPHDAGRNTQVIYTEFLQVMTSSMEALLGSLGALLSYFTAANISDGSCRGTSKISVSNWINMLRLFHDLTPVADCMPEDMQRILLQDAVLGLDALQQVQINSDLHNTTHRIALTFAQYRYLLIDAATGYNKQSIISPVPIGKLVIWYLTQELFLEVMPVRLIMPFMKTEERLNSIMMWMQHRPSS